MTETGPTPPFADMDKVEITWGYDGSGIAMRFGGTVRQARLNKPHPYYVVEVDPRISNDPLRGLVCCADGPNGERYVIVDADQVVPVGTRRDTTDGAWR